MTGDDNLIRFDRRAALFTAILIFGFVFCVAFKIHGSSLPQWNLVVPENQDALTGLLAGQPREIRSDEWLVATPFALSQYERGFPVRNPAIGAHTDPLLMSLPARHFSSLFRPQNWGWFVLGKERGFAFYWNFKVVGLALSSFFLLMLITGSRFWLSVAGAAWLYFSGFIQWWFSTNLPDILTGFNVIFIALVCLFLGRSRRTVIISAALLILFGTNFVLFLYPPFQVPLVWLLAALLAGFLLEKKRMATLRENLARRGLLLLGVGAAVAIILLLYYADARETVQAVTATAYPGKRVAPGGEIDLLKTFSGFTLAPLDERTFPVAWGNASEAGNFILLFPAVLVAAVAGLAINRRVSPMTASLSAYLILMVAWVTVGFPGALAKVSLLSLAPSNRALVGIGVAGVLLVMFYLGERDRKKGDAPVAVAASLAMLAFLLFLSYRYRTLDPGYFHWRNLFVMSFSFAAVSFLLINRYRLLFCLAVLLALAPSYRVNPVSVGLAPITENNVSRAAREAEAESPGAGWIVYGNNTLADFLIASGLTVKNGYKYTPDLDFFRAFDPSGAVANIYNRYANVSFAEAGAGQTRPLFNLLSPDAFIVKVDPCSRELGTLGISHFAFSYRPPEESVSCLTLVREFPASGVYFYRKSG